MYFVRVSRGESGGGNTYELMVAFNDPGRFRFSAPSYRATENARAATITVERVGGSAGTVTVDFAAFDGSATVPLDYLPVNGTLTFAEGETVKTFTVPIVNDALPEGDETVLLILSGATDGATLASPAFAELVLVETGPTPRLTLREDGGNRIISWPVWATGYQLESTVQLEDPFSWQVVAENVSVMGYENQVTLPASSWTMNFFRLRKP